MTDDWTKTDGISAGGTNKRQSISQIYLDLSPDSLEAQVIIAGGLDERLYHCHQIIGCLFYTLGDLFIFLLPKSIVLHCFNEFFKN